MKEKARRIEIEKVPLPSNSLVSSAFPQVDYWDAHRAVLPQGARPDIAGLSRAWVAGYPGWRIVDAVTFPLRRIGVKKRGGDRRSPPDAVPIEPGDSIAFFHVFDRSPNEILTGENQPHLDYRMSLLIEEAQGSQSVTVSTILRYNNWMGRVYFGAIRPFGKWIVRTMLRNALNRID